MEMLRKTRAEINLDCIEHNLSAFRGTLAKEVKVAGVVKANAYGHDIVTVTGLLLEEEADYIAVATVQEAALLRRNFPHAPLLVMGYTPDDQLPFTVDQGITQTVFSLKQCQLLSQRALATKKKAKVHIKVDTGLSRLGYRDHALALEEIIATASLKGVEIEGIFSHLALYNPESDQRQYLQFLALIEKLEARGVFIPIKHICDSIGAVAYPQYHMDMVRLGALLYGYCSRKTSFDLKPAMALRTEIAMVKAIAAGEGVSYDYYYKAAGPAKIATLPVGYADGLPRNIWQQGHVLINGQAAKFTGMLCMDQCMVDVTGLDVAVGDEVILFGRRGDQELPLDDLAKWCGTNKNELLSRVSPRVPRVFCQRGVQKKIVSYLM